MLDVFKDGAEAWLQRIKSPIIGSFVLSFCVINWKVIFFVVFSDTPILFRFWYFDTETSICTLLIYPAGTGFLIGLGTPYLNYVGTFLARWPTEKLRLSQAESAHAVMSKKAEFLIEREIKSADFKEAALRDAKATEAINDADLSAETRASVESKAAMINTSPDENVNPPRRLLTSLAREILMEAVASESGSFMVRETTSGFEAQAGNDNRKKIGNREIYLKMVSALAELNDAGYMSGATPHYVTLDGYERAKWEQRK
ncbi:hypothetical protein [Yoonia sp. I 8.24]|uniref:hypothetical protein n=1 Tax=Yoonia sp. I 8.24 TaxID=1537229 RepID=UPI001EE150C2|nr:hypothetical protein [Yoonia sp. I 8.24]MCG3267816.1 hypothetical protein [Yoonia sp. I 8.24]